MIRRRDFLGAGAAAGALLLSNALERPARAAPAATGFKLTILATSWGYTGSFDDYCARVKDAGYDGVELGWPDDLHFRDQVFDAVEKHELQVGFICIVLQPDGGFEPHFKRFAKAVEDAAHISRTRPLYLDCHSGRDYYSVGQNKQFYDHARQVSESTGLKVLHETHRTRMLYAPAVARDYMLRFTDMRIAFDVSHWCVVSESLLEDQADTVDMALARTDVIHARVGHAQGPQVGDPRAPEWAAALSAHLAWWDKAVAYRKARGEPISITAEFGPPDYMPTLPYTRQPVADQWAINTHMLHLLRQRYEL